MGKKSRQKQQRKAQAQAQPQQAKVNQGFTINVNAPQNLTAATPAAQPAMQVKPAASQNLLVSEDHIRGDILRIVLTLSVLGAILIALVIINDRSHVLQTAGRHLASFLKLNGN